MTALAIDHLRVRFGAVTALDDVSFNVGDDELLVVLGATGAGKTTLLRTIAGLQAPNSGTLAMRGTDVTAATPAERDVALVFQNFSLYGDRSVRENLAFPLRAPGRNLDNTAIAERVAWAAKLLRIEPFLDKPANRLSGGQMQRVAIGRALVRRPRLFLMDEPLTNLDAKLREALRVELTVLRREMKTPMVYVTHDQAEALSMGDRIVVLGNGRVLQVGTPEDIYCRPASPTVARQLGQPSINLLSARAIDGHWCTDAGQRLAPISGDPLAATATLGIRPEAIATSGGEHDAEVLVVESLGAERVVLATWLGQRIHLTVPATTVLHRGDRIRPLIDARRVVVWGG